jgi:predicted Zn finger-like uncharacterized protein
MRLTCPNCRAQYEVAAELIPAGGRDVQCSACGRTWLAGGAGADAAAPSARSAERTGGGMEEAEGEAEELSETVAGLAAIEAAGPAPEPRPRVSPAVAGILREERAREERARAAGLAIESAPDPAIAPGPAIAPAPAPGPAAPPPGPSAAEMAERERRRAEEARRRMARLRGQEAPPTHAALPAGTAVRRARLPDIEEINSTLHPTGNRAAPAPAAEARHPGGFRRGFGLALLVAAVLALLYVFAPAIVRAVPAATAVLDPYAAAIDGGRLWLDARLEDLLRLVATEEAPAGAGGGD